MNLNHSFGFWERACGPLKTFCILFLCITLLFSLLVKKSFIGQNKSFFGPLELVEKLCPEASDIATSVRNLPELKWVKSHYTDLMFKKNPLYLPISQFLADKIFSNLKQIAAWATLCLEFSPSSASHYPHNLEQDLPWASVSFSLKWGLWCLSHKVK